MYVRININGQSRSGIPYPGEGFKRDGKAYRKPMNPETTSLRGMVYASLFGALTAVGAYIIIPLPPVPITLQTLFLGLAGTLLGARLGALSQVVYLFLGILGLPVFAGGKAGLGVLFGPTGGYLIGFVAAAFVIGKLAALKARPGFAWLCLSLLAGAAVVYALGVLQLSLVARLSPVKAMVVGILPFLPGDGIKIVLTAMIALKLRDRFGGKPL
jgi:biotin transport system substrate-specific component